jgi:hypothetical protein
MAAGTGTGDQCDYFNPSIPYYYGQSTGGMPRISEMRQSDMRRGVLVHGRFLSLTTSLTSELTPDDECGVCIVLCVTGPVHDVVWMEQPTAHRYWCCVSPDSAARQGEEYSDVFCCLLSITYCY